MNKCKCGCGQEVLNTYLSGHDRRHQQRIIDALGGIDAAEGLATAIEQIVVARIITDMEQGK